MLISIYTKTDVYEIYARPHNLNQANYNQIYSGSSTSANHLKRLSKTPSISIRELGKGNLFSRGYWIYSFM